jgi:hypothetical protein
MSDAIWISNFTISIIALVIGLLIARFVFSISSILRNQRILIHLLSGIASKLNVEMEYFDHRKV